MCYTKGQRKQVAIRVAFWPWTQPSWLTSFMLFGALTAPSEEKDRFFCVAMVRSGDLFISYTGGPWWLCSWTSVPEDLRQHCRRLETLVFICILGICRNVSSISLPFWHMSSQLSLIELLPSGIFFLLNNPSCIPCSVKLALFHRILLAFSWLPFKTLLTTTCDKTGVHRLLAAVGYTQPTLAGRTKFPACIGILAYYVIHTKVHFCCLVEILSSLPLQDFCWLKMKLFCRLLARHNTKALLTILAGVKGRYQAEFCLPGSLQLIKDRLIPFSAQWEPVLLRAWVSHASF